MHVIGKGMAMEIELQYGKKGLLLQLPVNCKPTVIRKPKMPIIKDSQAAVAESLAKATNSLSLLELAKKSKSASIVICDITRPVPNHLFLRPMIETMISAGIKKEKICILVATGLHRPNLGEELKELINDNWVIENIKIINHNARDASEMRDLGVTSTRKTPVKINKNFIDADLKIVTGLVEPHFMAGYSGGRKVIAPGIAHEDTIRTFHNHKFVDDPFASPCNFEKNPLHEEQLEIVKKIGQVFAFNTVIDEERNLSFVSFGHILDSHMAAVNYVRKYAEVPISRKFKTIVSSSAGYPLDKTFYQTVKSMVTALDILEKGGDLIIVSECSEGIGSHEFKASQNRLVTKGVHSFLKEISQQKLASIDEWQTQMQTKAMLIGNVFIYATGIKKEDYSYTGVTRIDNLTDAIAKSMLKNQSSEVAIIPEGPYVVPKYMPT